MSRQKLAYGWDEYDECDECDECDEAAGMPG